MGFICSRTYATRSACASIRLPSAESAGARRAPRRLPLVQSERAAGGCDERESTSYRSVRRAANSHDYDASAGVNCCSARCAVGAVRRPCSCIRGQGAARLGQRPQVFRLWCPFAPPPRHVQRFQIFLSACQIQTIGFVNNYCFTRTVNFRATY